MSDFLNPLGGRFVGPSGPVATSAVAGTIPDPPRGFRDLDPGTIIKGIVLGRESDGLTAIATDKGTVRVASNALLPAGAQVTLEVRPAGDRLQVLILANDAIQRGAGQNTAAPPSSAGAQAAQTPPAPSNPKQTSPQPQPPATTATSAPGPDAHGTETRGPDLRGAATTPAPVAPTRTEQPSIEFVGSSLRAVVVQASSPVPPTLPPAQPVPAAATPAQPQQPLPPTQTLPVSPQPPAPSPLPPTTQPAQTQSIPTLPSQSPPVTPPPAARTAAVPASVVTQTPPPQPVQTPPAQIQPVPSQQAPLPPVTQLPPSVPTTATPVPVPTAPSPVTSPPILTNPTPTAPVPTTPVPTAPIPSTTTPLPQPAAPIPVTVVAPSPATLTSAAAMQATLLAAALDKKDGRGQPLSTPTTPVASQVTSANPDLQKLDAALKTALGQIAMNEPATPTGLTSQIPTSSALSADTRLRILALFATAATSAEDVFAAPIAAEEPPAAQTHLGKTPTQPLPLGAELKLRVLAVQMQAHQQIEIDPIAGDPHDPHAQVIFGRVVGITPAGHAVIHTPVGDIMLQNKSSLPLGARLALAINTLETTTSPAAMPIPMVQTPQQALLSLAQSWPTLADLIAVFQGSAGLGPKAGGPDPEIAQQALSVLPHAGTKLGAGLLNAMAALRSGDIGKLLGPLFAAKGAGLEREEMVRRLKGEFTQLSTLAQERPDVDWRALFLPILDHQGRVTQVNLFYRRPKKGETEDQAGSGTRFVVEADFSKLGPFQLDGLMRKQRFDLMVRSRARLTDRMRRDIEAIYEEARGLTGFTGAIAFQTVDDFPVIPLDDLKRASAKVTA